MEKKLTIPKVGENVTSIQVVKVLVAPGAVVKKDQPLLELETGKAVLEVPAPEAGRIIQCLVKEGDEVRAGVAFMVLSVEGAPPESAVPPTAPAVEEKPAQRSPEPEASVSARAAIPPADAPGKGEAEEPSILQAGLSAEALHVPAAPSVRRFARELGVDVDRVAGSGPHGRVSREDVMRHVRERGARPSAPLLARLPDFTKWGSVEEEKMTPIRRQTAEHLALCWSVIPHVTIHDRADITELEALRKKYADRAEKRGGKLTMAVMVTKVAASAVRQFRRFRSSVDMEKHRILVKDYVNIGIAVATERGLVVPVVRDADRKNMVEIAVEISGIAERARKGRLTAEEMEGGVFTVTNIGRVGGEYFTPIVNHPEVAILGMGRTRDEASASGSGGARTWLPLSLSFDHRVIDGADAARFLGWVVSAIEQPLLLALEG